MFRDAETLDQRLLTARMSFQSGVGTSSSLAFLAAESGPLEARFVGMLFVVVGANGDSFSLQEKEAEVSEQLFRHRPAQS
jgi:hypothetical protein